MINKKYFTWLKPFAFLLGLVLLICLISPLFTVTDKRIYQSVGGFYEEKPGSLDAVYIGASNVYASWQAPVAWKEYGIACYGYSVPSMPSISTKYLIEECRKTQPDAVYIINLNNFKSNGIQVTVSDIHNVTNFMPFSSTKINLINELSNQLGYSGLDKAEFYLPIIRFHSEWNKITPSTYDYELLGMKGSSSYSTFLKKSTNLKDSFQYTNKRSPLEENQETVFQDLVKYCQDHNVKTLFVFSPQVITNEIHIEQINTMKDYVIQEGFPVFDLMEDINSLNLDFVYDFYDKFHLNIHGSLKFTHAMGKYLKENYNFNDKRGNPDYTSWDNAATEYEKIIKPYTLDLERDHFLRDNTVSEPTLSCKASGQSIKIDWTKSTKATGYAIYRQHTDPKTGDLTAWKFLADVKGDTLKYTDKNLKSHVTYKYTVIPYYTKDGEKVYGNFSFKGTSATTTLPAPALNSAEESDNGVTLSWKDIKGEEGYIIYRRMGTQNWVRLATLDANTTSFTDQYYQKDLPYLYIIKAFKMINGKETVSDHDKAGLLIYKDIASPEPTIKFTGKGAKISWKIIDGATHYSVYAQDNSGKWNAIASHITASSYTDTTYKEEINPTYKVVAEIKHGSKYYEFPSNPIALTKGGN